MVQLKFSDDLNNEAWLTPDELSIHVVSETIPWPTQVQPLARALEVSLPQWVHDGPLSTLLRSDALVPIPPSCGDAAGDGKASLRAVLNLVLSTTTLMRPGPFEPPRFALLSTLVKGLLRVLQPDCVALENCALALPLASQPIEQVVVKLDPRKSGNTLLIALVHDDDSSSDECIPWDDGIADLKETRSELLPVLCVAPPDIIHSMLASTLHHHHVCGINQPVLGFTLLFPDGAIVCAVFGWLETNPRGLLRAHIAWAGPNACPNHAFGVFDLADDCSSLAFAQFVLNSQSCFEGLKASLSERSDHHSSPEHDDLQLGTPPQSGNRIMLWLNGMIEGERPTDRGSVKGSSKKSNTKAKSAAPTNATESAKTKPEGKESKLSNSELCAKSDRGLLDSWTIDNWMLERNAVSVSRHKVSVKGNEDSGRMALKKEINTMVGIYNEITSCTYPRSLLDEEKGPKVDPGVEGALKELREKLKSTPGCKAVDTEELSLLTQCMSDLLWSSVAAFVHDALAKVYGAKEVERRQAWDSLLTCCFRSMDSINVTEPEKVLLHLSLGHSISLARNCAMENLRETRTVDWSAHRKFIRHLVNVVHEVSEDLLNKITELAPLEAEIFYAQVGELRSADSTCIEAFLNLHNRIHDPDNAATTLEKRFAQERDTAICGAVVSVCLPNFLDRLVDQFDSMNMEQQNTFIKSFAFVHRPTKEGGNTEISLREVSQSASRESGSGKGDFKSGNKPPRADMSKGNFNRGKQAASVKRVSVFEGLAIVGEGNPADLFEELSPVNFANTLTTLEREPPKEKDSSPPRCKPASSKLEKDLLLPILVVEHKRADPRKEHVAINQSKIDAVSATAFLASVGVAEYPVFTLTIDGPIGILSMAWFSRKHQMTFVLDRNVVTFDISQPLEAFHFVCTMAKLVNHSKELKKRFEERAERLCLELTSGPRNSGVLSWTKKAQASVLKLDKRVEECERSARQQ
ncbi:hypothetical protein F5I97DRAFT_1909968 [Phlebopus sp. FC_14]|nr:hypothetical protein F5I97DRAFT_1909968 [Phlebopus sp. FC_14]